MPVKLHTCGIGWINIKGHACWRVEHALKDMGVEYERIPHPTRRSQRQEIEQLSGQRLYPAIEREDGTVWREESKQMEAAIRAGKLATTT